MHPTEVGWGGGAHFVPVIPLLEILQVGLESLPKEYEIHTRDAESSTYT